MKIQTLPTPEILSNGAYRFSDEEAGYSFEYDPDIITVSVGKDKDETYNHLSIQFNQIQGYGYQGMVLYILPNSQKLPPADFLVTDFKGKWKEITPVDISMKSNIGEQIDINGFPAVKTYLSNYLEIESAPFFVYLSYGNKIIGAGPMFGMISSSELAPEAEQVFWNVLYSLILTP
ncbi:MAG TPA: hypothetical protein PLX14_14885 [Anaerolineales bacterium]|nr:hypothetical protein [Anaerolineales bacterium]